MPQVNREAFFDQQQIPLLDDSDGSPSQPLVRALELPQPTVQILRGGPVRLTACPWPESSAWASRNRSRAGPAASPPREAA